MSFAPAPSHNALHLGMIGISYYNDLSGQAFFVHNVMDAFHKRTGNINIIDPITFKKLYDMS